MGPKPDAWEARYAISGVGNPPINKASIHIVDGRARIRGVRVQPASIDVHLGGSKRRSATVELNSAGYRTVVEAPKPHVSLPLPDGLPPDAWIWLKSGNEWLDFRPLNEWGGVASPDVRLELPEDRAAELSLLVTQGEGQFLEYKERLPANKDQKRNSIAVWTVPSVKS